MLKLIDAYNYAFDRSSLSGVRRL